MYCNKKIFVFCKIPNLRRRYVKSPPHTIKEFVCKRAKQLIQEDK